MAATKVLRVGIVGYGMMGRAHAYAYRAAPIIRPSPPSPSSPVVMSGRNADAVAQRGGGLRHRRVGDGLA